MQRCPINGQGKAWIQYKQNPLFPNNKTAVNIALLYFKKRRDVQSSFRTQFKMSKAIKNCEANTHSKKIETRATLEQFPKKIIKLAILY